MTTEAPPVPAPSTSPSRRQRVRSVLQPARRALSVLARSSMVRVLGTFIGVAVLVRSIDLPRAAHGLRDANAGWALAGVALTALALVSSVVEWGVLLRGTGHQLSWRDLSSLYLQGLFVGQVLPAAVGGDALRAVEVSKVTGHGHALASLAGSRMAGTLGMAVWGLAAAVLLRSHVGPFAIAGASAFVLAMVGAWAAALFADRVVRRLRGHTCPLRRQIFRVLHPFTDAFRGYRAKPAVLVQSLLVGAGGWGLNLCALAFFARSLGVDAGWSLFAVAIPVTLLATLAPFSLNGIGLREGVLVGLLAHAGVDATNAGALSVVIDLQMMPFALVGAALWMRRRSASRPRLRTAEAAAAVPL